MNKEFLKNIATLLISTFLSLLFCLFVLESVAKHEKGLKVRYFSNLDWEGRDINDIPDKRTYCTVRVNGNNEKYLVRINSQGLRDYEYMLDKPAGSIRIAAVGDSVTFGAGLDLEDTYVKQLERLLNHSLKKKVEVINFGAGGASTINELELIEKKVLLYKPDIILLQMDPNDSQIINQIKETDPYLNKIILKLKNKDSEISQWLRYKIEFYKYYRYKKGLTIDDEYNNVGKPLEAIVDICKKNNIKLVIMSYDPAYRGDYYDKVMAFIKGKGIPLLDLSTTKFGKLPYKEKYVNGSLDKDGSPIDSHPNKYGSKIIAEEISDFLETLPEESAEFLRQVKFP